MASRDHDNQDELLLFVMRRTAYTCALATRWQKNQDGRWS
jgi:hypothetical protein